MAKKKGKKYLLDQYINCSGSRIYVWYCDRFMGVIIMVFLKTAIIF